MSRRVIKRKVTPPSAPVLAAALTVDENSLDVVLQTPSVGTLPIASYSLERSTNQTTWVSVASGLQIFGSGATYHDTGLGQPVPFLQTPHGEVYPEFSPDGRWMAYLSVESAYELYVRPFPGPGGRWQISTGGGTLPRWSRDGRELLYLIRDGRMMTVSYTAKGDTFAAGKPQPWTETRLQFRGSAAIWDLAPDGKRIAAFVGSDPGGEKGPTHLMLPLNFLDQLQRRVPAGR